MTENSFSEFRLEYSCHRVFDLIEQLVNDAVKLDLDAFAFRCRNSHVFNFGVEADNNGTRGACEQNVRFRNWPDTGVNQFEIYFLAFDLFQRGAQCLERSLGVAFQNETKNFFASS